MSVIKQIFKRLADMRATIDAFEQTLFEQYAEEANFVEDLSDANRILNDKDVTELDGSYLSDELLTVIYSKHIRYNWHYQDSVFGIEPVYGNERGFLCYTPGTPSGHSFITFQSVADDMVEYGIATIWECIEARMVGIADGYIASLKKMDRVLAEMPEEDANPVGYKCDGLQSPVTSGTACSDRLIRAGGCPDEEPEKHITYYGG